MDPLRRLAQVRVGDGRRGSGLRQLARLPRLIEGAADADLVLGSRYMPGGGVAGWSWHRRLLSRGGCWYARRVLGVPVRDLTGGFKCFRREVLDSLDLADIDAYGYGFQIELTYRAVKAGFSVTEVPIFFRERRVGRSKMTARIAIEAVWKVPALRFRRVAGLQSQVARDPVPEDRGLGTGN